MGRESATSLAPGFRFHPTDEELVRYYLKRKVSGKSLRFDTISVVDIYKSEPWDLPGKSKLKTRDLEWYFFSALDKKYGNSSRTNRATEKGYWKTTGKDRPVRHNSRTVGMKKTLVFHSGRAPRGDRTNWVMHEYRLDDEELNKAGISQDGFVLCRVFQKSGTGPKNGEQYGAPFVEEEWEDAEELAFVPGQDQLPEEVEHGENVHLEAVLHGDDLHLEEVLHGNHIHLEDDYFDQIHEERSTSENGQLQSNFCCDATSNFVGESSVFIEDDQKPIVSMDDTSGLYNNELPENELKGKCIKDEYFSESSENLNPMDMIYFPDEPFACASDLPSTDGLYLETDDLLDSLKVDSVDFDLVDEYLTFFDEDQINAAMSFDPSEFLGGEVLSELPDEAPFTEKVLDDANESASMEPKHLSKAYKDNDASCSKQKTEASEMEPDIDHPFSKKVSNMLGCIPAPPAFASEFPSEDVIRQLQTAAQASTSGHVTAGIIEIRSTGLSRNWMDNLLGKNRHFNLILHFCASQSDVSSPTMLPNTESLHYKTGSSLSPCFFFFFMLLWVLILSVSFKVGSCIYTRRFTEL